MNYRRIIQAALETPWAIMPNKLIEIQTFLMRKANGEAISPDEIQAVMGEGMREDGVQRIASVAILPVLGTISHRINMTKEISKPGGTSTNMLANQLREAADDPAVNSIVLDIDSPGGSVAGIPELAELIMSIREKKRVVAVANGFAASAAYWIAAAASEIVVTPSGQVGSIGVFMMHQDVSKMAENEGVKTSFIHAGRFKVDGNSFEPLTETARADMQAKVDAYHDMFVKAVAHGRKLPPATVRGDFGEGRMILAKQAVAAGMADRVDTMDGTLERLLRRAAGRAGSGPRGEIKTIRDFEAFLRDAGWSQTEAKRTASEGFVTESPRDEGGEQPQVTETLEADELKRGLEELANSLRS